jgi:hypothetical protein
MCCRECTKIMVGCRNGGLRTTPVIDLSARTRAVIDKPRLFAEKESGQNSLAASGEVDRA